MTDVRCTIAELQIPRARIIRVNLHAVPCGSMYSCGQQAGVLSAVRPYGCFAWAAPAGGIIPLIIVVAARSVKGRRTATFPHSSVECVCVGSSRGYAVPAKVHTLHVLLPIRVAAFRAISSALAATPVTQHVNCSILIVVMTTATAATVHDSIIVFIAGEYCGRWPWACRNEDPGNITKPALKRRKLDSHVCFVSYGGG